MCFVFSVASREKKGNTGGCLSPSATAAIGGFLWPGDEPSRTSTRREAWVRVRWRELTESERSGVEKDLMPSNLALWVGFCLA